MSLFSTVARLASSPQGKAAIRKAKDAAGDPRNRAKIDGVVNKIKQKGGRGGGPQTPGGPRP